MANDRLYIKCNVCNKSTMIYKYNPDNSYVFNPTKVGNWFINHEECLDEKAEYSMYLDKNLNLFSFTNENGEEI